MYRERLEEELPDVRARIERAAARSGRSPGDVTLVVVTKGHPIEAVEAVLETGLRDLGENRVEELERKAGQMRGAGVRWHMVGHVQRRAAPKLRDVAYMLHSLDSLRLAERLERTAPPGAEALRVLAQVNTSGEASKSGFSPTEVMGALERLTGLPSLRVEGLMTMAPLTEDERIVRKTFRDLKALHEEARAGVPTYRGVELSMGMSNDFELAVEEGSTIVRVGTALLGERLK
jgi:pyridoxal phosphate enzyme (YggS family)